MRLASTFVSGQAMSLPYRFDIDGLRAIAVLLVVAYHVGVPGFSGGFVGVDVFFVISGYLITRLLLKEIDQRGSIDLVDFYARRARRLLPAFFLVVSVTLILAAVLLLPIGGEQQELARSAKASALYISNLYFARNTGGYFDNSSELLPLLHTWSLAVEEQFYFVWPILIISCWRFSRRVGWDQRLFLAAVLIVVCFSSLIFSQLGTTGSEKSASFAFFSLPARAWELGIGAGIALIVPFSPFGPKFSGLLVTAGLLGIAASALVFETSMPFPGFAALLPTLGAACVIWGGAFASGSLFTRLLSTRLLVSIGLLSYSWYLWHWPLLAIDRAWRLGAEDLWRDLIIALVGLGLAWLTYSYVEHRVRSRRAWGHWSNARVLSTAAAASVVTLAAAQALEFHADMLAKNATYKRLAQAENDRAWAKGHCFYKNGMCSHDAGTPYRGLVVLWGDSHANHFAGTLHGALAPQGLSMLLRDSGGCPPVQNALVFAGQRELHECSRFNDRVLTEIASLSLRGDLRAVVLSARWPLYVERTKLSGEASPRIIALPGQRASREAAPDALYEGLRATIRALVDLGVKVAVIAPAPEYRYDIPACLARKSLKHCSISLQEIEIYRRLALVQLSRALEGLPRVRLWDPVPGLCSDDWCPVERDGLVLYHDNNHLTYRGSRWLAPHFRDMATWFSDNRDVSSSLQDNPPDQFKLRKQQSPQ